MNHSIQDHFENVNGSLNRLPEAKLYGHLHVFEFLKDRVDYLGVEARAKGIHASRKTVKTIVDGIIPGNLHSVHGLLGLA